MIIKTAKQTQNIRDNARKNKHWVDYDYKVRDKFMLTNPTVYKYETPYQGPFFITKCFTNGTVNLQRGTTQIKYNIRRIKKYKLDTKIEDFISTNIGDAVNI